MIFIKFFFLCSALCLGQSLEPEERDIPVITPIMHGAGAAYNFTVNGTRAILNFINAINNTFSGVVQGIDGGIDSVLNPIQAYIDGVQEHSEEMGKKMKGLRKCVVQKLEEFEKDGLQTVSNVGGCAMAKVRQIEDFVKEVEDLTERVLQFIPETFISLDACGVDFSSFPVLKCYFTQMTGAASKAGIMAKEVAVLIPNSVSLISLIPTLPASLPLCASAQLAKFGVNATMIGATFAACSSQELYGDVEQALAGIKNFTSSIFNQ